MAAFKQPTFGLWCHWQIVSEAEKEKNVPRLQWRRRNDEDDPEPSPTGNPASESFPTGNPNPEPDDDPDPEPSPTGNPDPKPFPTRSLPRSSSCRCRQRIKQLRVSGKKFKQKKWKMLPFFSGGVPLKFWDNRFCDQLNQQVPASVPRAHVGRPCARLDFFGSYFYLPC